MLRYITLFVLVLLVIKTNAQETFYYAYNGQKIPLEKNYNNLLIRVSNPKDSNAKKELLNKVWLSSKYDVVAKNIYNEYFLLERKDTNDESVSDIDYFLSEPYVSSANFGYKHAMGGTDYISNELILVCRDNTADINTVQSFLKEYKYTRIYQDSFNKKEFHIFLSKDNASNALEVANNLYQTGYFTVSAPNFFSAGNISSCTQNDWAWGTQWSIDGSVPGADINICPAWDLASGGSNVNVAVIDVGVDLNHEDLTGKILSGIDFTPENTGGACSPNQNHGTSMAGIIAANRNNNTDMAGISNASILPIRAFKQEDGGSTVYFDDSHLSEAIEWAYQNGADVINCSWDFSFPDDHPTISAAFYDAFYLGRGGQGCVILCASGNYVYGEGPGLESGDNVVRYPGSNQYVFSVGNMDNCLHRHANSSCTYGGVSDDDNFTSCYGTDLKIMAPGMSIVSLVQTGEGTIIPGQPNMSVGSGTSEATAIVSGVAAIMLSINHCMPVWDVYDVLEATASKVGGYSYATSYTYGSWDPEMGFGEVNAGNAATLAHDVYKQNQTLTSSSQSYVAQSAHKAYAGYNVTSVFPDGNYEVGSGVSATLYAPECVSLEPGFVADNGSIFLAAIHSLSCDATIYWKQNSFDSTTTNVQNQNLGVMNAFDINTNISVFPNPITDKININYQRQSFGQLDVKVEDVAGRIRYKASVPCNQGNSQIYSIDATSLESGTYFVDITLNNEHVVKKVVKTVN